MSIPMDGIPFKGQAFRTFMQNAFFVLFRVQQRDEHDRERVLENPHDGNSEYEIVRAAAAGWEFAMACLQAKQLHYTFLNLPNGTPTSTGEVMPNGVAVFDGALSDTNIVLKGGPYPVLKLLEQYVDSKNTLALLEQLDDVQQFMHGSCKRLFAKHGNKTEQALYEFAAGKFTTAQQTMRQIVEGPENANFMDLWTAIVEGIERTINGLVDQYITLEEQKDAAG